jgi:hypothetical protein
MNTITIKQLMEIHEAITQAMRAMDHAEMNDCGQSWHDLSRARVIVRTAIESTGAVVEISEAE